MTTATIKKNAGEVAVGQCIAILKGETKRYAIKLAHFPGKQSRGGYWYNKDVSLIQLTNGGYAKLSHKDVIEEISTKDFTKRERKAFKRNSSEWRRNQGHMYGWGHSV